MITPPALRTDWPKLSQWLAEEPTSYWWYGAFAADESYVTVFLIETQEHKIFAEDGTKLSTLLYAYVPEFGLELCGLQCEDMNTWPSEKAHRLIESKLLDLPGLSTHHCATNAKSTSPPTRAFRVGVPTSYAELNGKPFHYWTDERRQSA